MWFIDDNDGTGGLNQVDRFFTAGLKDCAVGRWFVAGVLAVLMLANAAPARAQVANQSIPSDTYYSGFALLNEGNLKGALETFRGALRSGMLTGQQRWIDSICYYSMVGETYYRMGMYTEAKENFDAALNLAITFPNWMMRVRFPDSIATVPAARRITEE